MQIRCLKFLLSRGKQGSRCSIASGGMLEKEGEREGRRRKKNWNSAVCNETRQKGTCQSQPTRRRRRVGGGGKGTNRIESAIPLLFLSLSPPNSFKPSKHETK